MYDSFIAALEHVAKGTQGLSGVMGNYHAPFLGEGAAAMPPPYPTNCFECLIEAGVARQIGVQLGCIRWRGGVS